MKKIFPLLSTSTGLPLTGRQITLVRSFPNDGAEVACSELNGTGTYLANGIQAGLYKVFDRTSGTPGTDLDQMVDVASVTLAQPLLPTAASGFLSAPSETFQAIQQADVSGLPSTLSGISASIAGFNSSLVSEQNARSAGDASLLSSLNTVIQESSNADILVTGFAGLSDIINSATETDQANNKAKYIVTSFKRKSDGKILFSDIDFSWSRTFLHNSDGGWKIPSNISDVGAAFISFLRNTIWGIGPGSEWSYPTLNGTLWIYNRSYPVSMYDQSAGSQTKITFGGGFSTSTDVNVTSSNGRLNIRIPGV